MPESNDIDSGAMQINYIIIFFSMRLLWKEMLHYKYK